MFSFLLFALATFTFSSLIFLSYLHFSYRFCVTCVSHSFSFFHLFSWEKRLVHFWPRRGVWGWHEGWWSVAWPSRQSNFPSRLPHLNYWDIPDGRRFPKVYLARDGRRGSGAPGHLHCTSAGYAKKDFIKRCMNWGGCCTAEALCHFNQMDYPYVIVSKGLGKNGAQVIYCDCWRAHCS